MAYTLFTSIIRRAVKSEVFCALSNDQTKPHLDFNISYYNLQQAL